MIQLVVMEDIYRMNPFLSSPQDHVVATAGSSQLHLGLVASNYLQMEEPEPGLTGSEMSDRLIKSQIASHPLYPNLVSAYIECQKVIIYLCIYFDKVYVLTMNHK